MEIAGGLETANGSFDLQQQGDLLVKRLREIREEQRKGIQGQIDMLKQESEEAIHRVRELLMNMPSEWYYAIWRRMMGGTVFGKQKKGDSRHNCNSFCEIWGGGGGFSPS